MRTSGLSAEGISATLSGRCARCGSMPQPVLAISAKRHNARKTPVRIRCDRMTFAPRVEIAMRMSLAVLALSCSVSLSTHAALDIGERAPDFTTKAALGGSVYSYSLAESLKQGPVVLYFFPAAYSEGCSAEAHYFAEAIKEFKSLGASVIGVSGDDIDTLSKFSVQACQSQFPVASDKTQSVMKSFDAVMKTRPEYANRISYVIAPDGTIVYHYQSLNPTRHVENALGALRTRMNK